MLIHEFIDPRDLIFRRHSEGVVPNDKHRLSRRFSGNREGKTLAVAFAEWEKPRRAILAGLLRAGQIAAKQSIVVARDHIFIAYRSENRTIELGLRHFELQVFVLLGGLAIYRVAGDDDKANIVLLHFRQRPQKNLIALAEISYDGELPAGAS